MAGYVDEAALVCESAVCMYRAGADLLITYFAKRASTIHQRGENWIMQTTQSEAWFQRAKRRCRAVSILQCVHFHLLAVHRDLFVKQRAIISMI